MSVRHILLVDDECYLRLSLKQMLEDAGYRILTAKRGSVALNHLETRPCDFVLLDLRMPQMHGQEVLTAMNPRRPNLPFIIVTAHGTVDHAVAMIRKGAESVILKPFTPEQIRMTGAQALAQEPTEDATHAQHIADVRGDIRAQEFERARQHIQQAFSGDATRPEAFNLLGVLAHLYHRYQEAWHYC